MKQFFISVIILLLSLPSVAADRPDPLTLVKATADRVLHEVQVHKTTMQSDNSIVYSIVNTHVLPHFDFEYMTRSAVGRYWRKANDAQKQALQEEFSRLLVKTYGVALLNYSGQEIIYMPLKPSNDDDRVMVETKVAENNGGPQIPVNYRLRFKDSDWKEYDVVIDGISLVSNYRSSFASQIRRSGIDGLIDELAKRNKG